MMSYLWILLLGSLLASPAMAQDDVTPEEEAGVPDTADSVTEPETGGEPDEDVPATEGDPEPDADPEAEAEPEPVSPDAEDTKSTEGDAEVTAEGEPTEGDPKTGTPAVEEVPTEGEPEAGTTEGEEVPTEGEPEAATTEGEEVPTEGEPEAVTPEGEAEPEGGDADATTSPEDVETVAPEGSDVEGPEEGAEATTPAVDDPEAETVTPTQAGADLDVKDDQTTDAVEVPGSKSAENDDQEKSEPAKGTTPAAENQENVRKEVRFDVGLKLEDALDIKPEEKRSNSNEPGNVGASEADKPKSEEGSGSLAGILSAIIVSAVGAVSGYFAYQKKKLCFKNRQEADPEAARKADAAEAQSDPQALNTLLNSS
ncbi:uncharacterized protein ACNS7B_023642 [Menidia menidia]